MRFMVVIKPQFQLPEEKLPAMIEGFAAWWDRHRDTWESAGFFAHGNGGGGICNVESHAALHQMFLEWPFTPFSDIESFALIDMDEALGHWQGAIAAMVAAQSGS
jgi:hypothetical protein